MVSLHRRLKITFFWHVFSFIYPARCRGIRNTSYASVGSTSVISFLYSIFSAGALAYDQCLFSTGQEPTEYRKLSWCLFEFEGTTSSEEYCFVSRLRDLMMLAVLSISLSLLPFF